MSGAAPVIPDYTLLRPIGRGAYGEVWLVRSITGLYRAAKIIHRDRFNDPRPFEREFAGIQRIEPISRAGEHQLTVLHVGRNEEAGYFYCVMELADDIRSGAEILPETYVPKTLREMSERQQRLPAAECLGIAVALTRALSQLHGHGLVHRDIKPSNVIFVHGVPKLADIGLVSTVDESASFVGTEGFVPPEGPGSVQADLYSLGKVIYEISTGRDRTEFPQLPVDLETIPDKRALLELNEVTLKACDPAPHRRYASARAMHDDLLLLQAGKSVRRLHAMERRFRLVSKYGIAATALSVIAAIAFFWASSQARIARENFQLSERHRHAAEQALRESELNQARARRMTGIAGRRFEALDLLRKAAGTSNQLPLRNEAIASLVLPDLRPQQTWSNLAQTAIWVFDSGVQRYLTNDALGNITIRDAADNRTLVQLPGSDTPLTALIADDSFRFVAAMDKASQARIWDVARQTSVTLQLPGGARLVGFAQRELIVRHFDGSFHFIDPATGKGTRSWKGPYPFHHITFNSSETLFLGKSDRQVLVYEGTNGTQLMALGHPEAVIAAAWHPDDRRVATGCGKIVYLWDTAPRQILGLLEGHESRVVGLAFHDVGDLLISSAWDTTTRIWDVQGRRELVRASSGGNHPRISPDGKRLAFRSWDSSRVELWELASGGELGRVEIPAGRTPLYRQTYRAGFHPDGSLLHIEGPDGSHLFDSATRRLVRTLHEPSGAAGMFDPAGSGFVTIGAAGLRRWPVAAGPAMEVGPPQTIMPAAGLKRLAISRDGKRLAAVSQAGVHTLDSVHEEPSFFPSPGSSTSSIALSADGRWMALGGRDRVLRIVDTRTGELTTNFVAREVVHAVFSPDNRWLAVVSPDAYELRVIGTWEPGPRIERPGHRTSWPNIAFTSDGQVLALTLAGDSIHLLDTKSFQEFATLPTSRMNTYLCFSPDDTRLLVLYEAGSAELWDLRLIRHGLAELNLSWPQRFPATPVLSRKN